MGMLITSCANNTAELHIGDNYGGGIICYLDYTKQHGLICAEFDQSSGTPWSPTNTATSATNTPLGQGEYNTSIIVNAFGPGNYAAYMCDTLTLNGYTDWFLPCRDELIELRNNLKSLGIGNLSYTYYWCSSENNYLDAVALDFGSSPRYFLS